MKNPQKIYVNRDDEVAQVIDKILSSSNDVIILIVPKFSSLAANKNNFHLLKRETEFASKSLSIESVDDRALEFAKNVGLKAENSFFASAGKIFSDIAPPAAKRNHHFSPPVVNKRTHKAAPIESDPLALDAETDAEEVKFSEHQREIEEEIEAEFGKDEVPKKRHWRNAAVLISCLVFSAASYVLAAIILPEADIKIVTQKTNVNFASTVFVDKSLSKPDFDNLKIPGQLFTAKRNATLPFKATGKKQISKKAVGKITIYNAYSSERQKLVASTRFMTGDGHVVRLAETVIVPGAKIVDGKIVASSLEAGVISDQPGVDSNFPPAKSLTIPGFKGSPRYEGFYGELREGMQGGFVGEKGYPTDEDIRKAKSEVAATLSDAAKLIASQKIPSEFKTIPSGAQFSITKQTVNGDVDSSGNFSIYAEGETSIMAFRESDIFGAIREKINREVGADFEIKNQALNYGLARLDTSTGKMTFPIDFKSVVAKAVNAGDLKSKILKKSEIELKAMLLAMPGLESAHITLWPFWVRSVPASGRKVKITVE